MVSLRRTGGRNAATVVGATSAPPYVTEPLASRSGARGSQQYSSAGMTVIVIVTVIELPTTSAPAKGMTTGPWSRGVNPTG